jgi:hypothetical protein
MWQEILRQLASRDIATLSAAMALCRTSRALYALRAIFLADCRLRICNGETVSLAERTDPTVRLHGLVEIVQYRDISPDYRIYEFGHCIERIIRGVEEDVIVYYWYIGDTVTGIVEIEHGGTNPHVYIATDVECDASDDVPMLCNWFSFKIDNGCISPSQNTRPYYSAAMAACARKSRLMAIHRATPFW